MNKSLISLILFIAFPIISFAQNSNKFDREVGEFMMRGDVKGAIAVLDKAIEKKKNLFEAYKVRATLRTFAGDVDGAIADLTNALAIKPTDGELYYQRGNFRTMNNKNPLEALKDYDSAIAFGYKSEKVYVSRGSMKERQNDFDGAIADYETATAISPDYISAQLGIATALRLKGDTAAAIVRLQEFLDRYERDSDKKSQKIKGKTVAVQATESSVSKNAENTTATLAIQGIEAYEAPSSPKELEKFQREREQSRNLASAYSNLASMYLDRGNLEKAFLNIEKSLKINTNDFYARSVRGKLRMQKNDFSGAVSDFDYAISVVSILPENYLNRGIALFMMGKDAAAQKDFDKYLQLLPSGKVALEERIEAAKQQRLQN